MTFGTFGTQLSSTQVSILTDTLSKYPEVFATNGPLCKTLSHGIKLVSGATPYRGRPYKLSHDLIMESKIQIQDMLAKGVIRKSISAWRSPCFFVKKKNGKWRFVVDFRRLNAMTVKDAFPLPNIDNLLTTFTGCEYFTTLDCESGYWQIPLEEESKPLTAFEMSGELYEFNVMPFGLCNAPSSFQRIMTIVLSGVTADPYIDDIVIASGTFNQHVKDVQSVLDRLKEHSLRLQPTKCVFGADSVNYLGHIVSKSGLSPDPQKVNALKSMVAPTTRREADRYCGFVNYLSRYIPNLAGMMKPIFVAKSSRGKFKWDENCQKAFCVIQDHIRAEQVLKFPDFSKPFHLYVDASDIAMGGYLRQESGPIGFFSKTLDKAQRNYSATDREFCALINALKHFRHIIHGYHTFVHTDHSGLIGLIEKRPPSNSRHARYLMEIADYDIEVQYVRGKDNYVADYLSRDTQKPILVDGPANGRLNPLAQPFVPKASSQPQMLNAVAESLTDDVINMYHKSGHFSINKVRRALLDSGYWAKNLRARISKVVNKCEICLQAKNKTVNKATTGHLPCLAEVQPREFVAIDIVGPLPLCNAQRYIVTMIDHASKFLVAVPCADISAKRVSQIFRDNWLLKFGPPRILHSDNGRQFISSIFAELLKKHKVIASHTTVYHPQGNGVLERVHSTLKDRLRTMVMENSSWVLSLPEATYNINRHINATGISSFMLMFGYQPKAAGDWSVPPVPKTCHLPCPTYIYPRVFLPRSCLSPRFGHKLKVSERLSEQLIRTADGNVYNLSNCKAIF